VSQGKLESALASGPGSTPPNVVVEPERREE
jgi:hypothetical protein